MKAAPLFLLFLLPFLTSAAEQDQAPLKLSHHVVPTMSSMSDKPSGPPLLGDILPLDKQISIFSGFTRSVESISTLLSNRNQNTTVLAPSNHAVAALPRKPWEDPDGDADLGAYRGAQGEDRAGRNLRRFVEAHCIGVSPWKEREMVRTVEGVAVWWERGADGRRRIMPDGIEVVQTKEEVANGQLWVIEGVVNYGR